MSNGSGDNYRCEFVYFQVFSIVSFLLTITSILVFCIETVPGVRSEMTAAHYAEYYEVSENEYKAAAENAEANNSTSAYPERADLTVPNDALNIVDMSLMCYFILELVLRFVACPYKKSFFCHPAMFFDLLSVLPFFIELIAEAVDIKETYKANFIDSLFLLKIVRIFRVFRMIQHTQGFLVLQHTIRASWKDLLLMISFMTITVVLFGSLIYIFNHNEVFVSIPKSFWWAIVTITTVGYGDMVPSTPMGHLIGALCTVTGVLMLAFTVPTIVNNFMMFYSHIQYPRQERTVSKSGGEGQSCVIISPCVPSNNGKQPPKAGHCEPQVSSSVKL